MSDPITMSPESGQSGRHRGRIHPFVWVSLARARLAVWHYRLLMWLWGYRVVPTEAPTDDSD